jgi:EAL domain-containing protein (putative c-di-GMP-specific phosphodiesterase class I)
VVTVQIEAAIKRAIDTGQFEPHFQSRVDTDTGRVHGLEALIRWTSPELAGYTNYQLIPIAERSLLATELDSQMLRKVVQWLAALAVDGIRIPVAVNLSARSLQRAAFPDEIRALVQAYGVDIKQIELELTETVLIEKNDVVGRNVASLHDMGVRLLLADFGRGYSSLRYLHELPIAIVKIDRTFIQTLPDDASSLAIVESTIELVHRLGKRVVAEGIETYAQWETLRSLGCDEVQGYFFMRPQGPKVVAEMLRQQFDTTVGHLTVDLTHIDKSEDFSFSNLSDAG